MDEKKDGDQVKDGDFSWGGTRDVCKMPLNGGISWWDSVLGKLRSVK